MRAPYQVLVIPYRRRAGGLEYAVLKRKDSGSWQFVAGGGEADEQPIEAAHREVREEIGLKAQSALLALDSTTSIPKSRFHTASAWGDDVFIIPEHSFALDVGSSKLSLSKEHTELRWVPYVEARALLKWDSNRTALWELRERLRSETST